MFVHNYFQTTISLLLIDIEKLKTWKLFWKFNCSAKRSLKIKNVFVKHLKLFNNSSSTVRTVLGEGSRRVKGRGGKGQTSLYILKKLFLQQYENSLSVCLFVHSFFQTTIVSISLKTWKLFWKFNFLAKRSLEIKYVFVVHLKLFYDSSSAVRPVLGTGSRGGMVQRG